MSEQKQMIKGHQDCPCSVYAFLEAEGCHCMHPKVGSTSTYSEWKHIHTPRNGSQRNNFLLFDFKKFLTKDWVGNMLKQITNYFVNILFKNPLESNCHLNKDPRIISLDQYSHSGTVQVDQKCFVTLCLQGLLFANFLPVC